MTNEKVLNYRKAYVELIEIIKVLNEEQRNAIPNTFIQYAKNNMDPDYSFDYDTSKTINEQNLSVETQALLVELYERYWAPANEKEFWEKYDRICTNMIEEEKTANYTSNLFEDNYVSTNPTEPKEEPIQNLPTIVENKSIFKKILSFIKNIFNKDKF